MATIMDSKQEMEMYQEIFEFVDEELCGLKTCYEAMEEELKNTRTELINALSQQEKFKEERDELCKLAEYWK